MDVDFVIRQFRREIDKLPRKHPARYTLLTVLTVLTFLPLWRHEAWWVRGGDFPRLQFAIAAVILLAIAALVLDLSRPGRGL